MVIFDHTNMIQKTYGRLFDPGVLSVSDREDEFSQPSIISVSLRLNHINSWQKNAVLINPCYGQS